MASSSNLLLLLSFVAILPLLSSARPCKSLFVSYSFSTISTSSNSIDHAGPTPIRYFSVYRIFPIRTMAEPHPHPHPHPHPRPMAAAAAAAEWSSMVDRTRDILVIVAGLLFGVGCGAITAATIYLAWSLVTNQHHLCADAEDDEDYGYVKMVEEPLIAAPAPTAAVKEGYEAK